MSHPICTTGGGDKSHGSSDDTGVLNKNATITRSTSDSASGSIVKNNDHLVVMHGTEADTPQDAATNNNKNNVTKPIKPLETVASNSNTIIPVCIQGAAHVRRIQDPPQPWTKLTAATAITTSSFKKEEEEQKTAEECNGFLKQEETNGEAEQKEEDKDEEDDEVGGTLLDVYNAMDNLSSPGSTCIGGVALNLPVLPGLTLEGVGLVPLPLTQETAQSLKSVFRQAPHGRGTETVIDTSVRNTLEMDANQVSLKNPDWSVALTKLVGDVAVALGVQGDLVRPELYKLLLYETGGLFKKHRDTEKVEGMFATLVVQLPSCFTGGNFVVTHNKILKPFVSMIQAQPPIAATMWLTMLIVSMKSYRWNRDIVWP